MDYDPKENQGVSFFGRTMENEDELRSKIQKDKEQQNKKAQK